MEEKIMGIEVSLIIVNWNTKDLLLQCIESIYSTTVNATFEIIVVDNNSNDGSAQEVKKNYADVIVIENEKNFGFAAANNIGIRKSNGRYICLINSDIIFLPECLDNILAYMNNNIGVGAAGPKTVGGDNKFQLHCRRFPSLLNGFNEIFWIDKVLPDLKLFQGRLIRNISQKDATYVDVLPMCFFIIRREILDQVGLLDEQFYIYGEDKDWCKRLRNHKSKLAFYPGATAVHLGGASSAAEPMRFNLEMMKSDLLYWRKHHTWIEYYIYVFIKILHQLVRMYFLLLPRKFKPKMLKVRMNFQERKRCLAWILKTAFDMQ